MELCQLRGSIDVRPGMIQRGSRDWIWRQCNAMVWVGSTLGSSEIAREIVSIKVNSKMNRRLAAELSYLSPRLNMSQRIYWFTDILMQNWESWTCQYMPRSNWVSAFNLTVWCTWLPRLGTRPPAETCINIHGGRDTRDMASRIPTNYILMRYGDACM